MRLTTRHYSPVEKFLYPNATTYHNAWWIYFSTVEWQWSTWQGSHYMQINFISWTANIEGGFHIKIQSKICLLIYDISIHGPGQQCWNYWVIFHTVGNLIGSNNTNSASHPCNGILWISTFLLLKYESNDILKPIIAVKIIIFSN